MKRRLSSGRALKSGRLLLEGAAEEEEEEEEEEEDTETAAAVATATEPQKLAAAKQQQQQQQRPMSNEQLSAMYANVIRLCAQNRVTPQNAWSLKLIDHIDAVLDQPQQQHRQPAAAAAAAVSPPLPLPPPSVPPAAAADAATRRGGRGAAARGGDDAVAATTTTNFQLASCTLDASALIYSARVDSVHRTAYEVLGGLSHASEKHRSAAADAADDADVAEADEDADDAAAADALLLGDDGGSAGAAAVGGDAAESGAKGGEQRAPRQRKAHAGAVETLDTPENLCAKHAEPAADDDPLFRKVSAALNAGGCRGLLLNNLCAVHGTQIALEPSALPDADPPPAGADADADKDEMLDAASIAGFLTGPDVEAMQICAVIHDYRLNGPASSTSSAAVTLKAEPLLPLDDSDDDGGAATTAVEPSDAPGADDAGGMFGDDCVGCGPLAFDAGEDVDEADDAQPVPLATTLDDGDVQATRNEFSFFDPKLLRNWAGPDHWKFPSKKKPAQQSTNGTGTKAGDDSNEANEEEGGGEEEERGRARKRQRRKEEPLIDFTAPAKIDRKLFDPPAKAATTLSDAALRRHTAQATTLPPDVHYDVSMLSRLFLNPSWRITERRARAPTAVAASVPSVLPDSQPAASQEWYEYHNPTADDGNEEDDDPDGDAAGDTDFGMAAAAGGDFDEDDGGAEQRLEETQCTTASGARAPVLSTLVALPQHVQQVSIGYARAIRRMDVAAVKAALWRALTRVTADHPDEMPQRERRRPFRSLLEALPALLPPAILAELSVAFCFVCLLHLCNEKGLRLEGGGSSELVVLLK